MERRSSQSKVQSKSLSPYISPSTSRKFARSKYLRSEVEHPSPKSLSDTQPILSHDFYQDSIEVQYLI